MFRSLLRRGKIVPSRLFLHRACRTSCAVLAFQAIRFLLVSGDLGLHRFLIGVVVCEGCVNLRQGDVSDPTSDFLGGPAKLVPAGNAMHRNPRPSDAGTAAANARTLRNQRPYVCRRGQVFPTGVLSPIPVRFRRGVVDGEAGEVIEVSLLLAGPFFLG